MSEFGFGHVVFLVALYFLLIRPLMSGYRRGRTGESENSADTTDQFAVESKNGQFQWPKSGNYDFDVVGESNYQKALQRLAGNHGAESVNKEFIAELIPEDSNRFDSKAVQIVIAREIVGYLSRADARSFRRRLAQKKLSGEVTTCHSIVVGGGTRKNGEKLFYGVRLDIKPFE